MSILDSHLAHPRTDTYSTDGGVSITRRTTALAHAEAQRALARLTSALDTQRGVLLGSSFEYPGRYSRYDIGFSGPMLELSASGREFHLRALKPSGQTLLAHVEPVLCALPSVATLHREGETLAGTLVPFAPPLTEEARSRAPSVFDVLRALLGHLRSGEDTRLGLYGAFGYDLGFQFEPVREALPRGAGERDLVLYVPDELLVIDHRERQTELLQYTLDGAPMGPSTLLSPAPSGQTTPPPRPEMGAVQSDHSPAEFEAGVEAALEAFARGDLFEAVLSQTYSAQTSVQPSRLYEALKKRNPSPYGFIMNLGAEGHLVGASPEMFVRVEGRRVETCPIAGTTARGANAMEDATRLLDLLNDQKEEDELTMCTDVDRNDKARVCEPGSVRVIGRRQVEMYSRLMHTVDHVEGTLREDRDALDAFLAHTWAVTVTGAPKPGAMQFIEDHEKSPRRFYSGAVGALQFNGDMNTGLTLRTAHLLEGMVHVRAGATLLHASIPAKEAAECRLKASAVFDALNDACSDVATGEPTDAPRRGTPLYSAASKQRVLLVDHRDSFVHTLGDYLRQTGAHVETVRAGFDLGRLRMRPPDLLVLSPGPGRPDDFGTRALLEVAAETGCAVFGVCLGLQAIVEYEGGNLAQLPVPRHGSGSLIADLKGPLFDHFPPVFRAGRYHSLHAATLDGSFPTSLRITALGPRETLTHAGVEREGCVVMGVSHVSRPWHAVQFHPESIMTASGLGMQLMRNALATSRAPSPA